MRIKGFLKDVTGASTVTKRRQKAFDKASSAPYVHDPIGEVARALHPGLIDLKVTEIREDTPLTKIFRFEAPHLPLFKAGQLMTLVLKIGESLVTRSFSICSAPSSTRGERPFIEITVARIKGSGFASAYLHEEVKVGDVLKGEAGLGEFYVHPIRDSEHIVGIAGGLGATHFLSMAKEIAAGKADYDLTLFYIAPNEEMIFGHKDFDECISDRVKIIYVLPEDNKTWKGEKGTVDANMIKKYAKEDSTYFVCAAYSQVDFYEKEFEKLGVPKRRIHLDIIGATLNIFELGYPKELADKEFKLTVIRGIHETVIPILGKEPIASALEKAGIKIHAACRAGACGFCRIQVLKGDYFVCPINDGRRAADEDFNYVHSCSTYPKSDMKIRVNIDE